MNLDRLDQWTSAKSMRSSKAKHQEVHLGLNNPMKSKRLREDWLENCPGGK